MTKLFLLAVIVYGLFTYGGTRSPDEEIIFRTGEAIALHGTFAVSDQLDWEGFGLPRGKDGRRYSVFGPLESIAMAPFVYVAEMVNRSGWYQSMGKALPISYHVDGGLGASMRRERPQTPRVHALRFLVSPFNAVVSALCVAVFFLLARQLVERRQSAVYAAITFALGSLAFPYSGTFFSEPLATLAVMLSVLLAMRRRPLASGLCLGLATATHITGILFAPFILFYALSRWLRIPSRRGRDGIAAAGLFVLGMGIILALLGWYNHARFGSILETGRTADAAIKYSRFVAPWRGLYGLLVGGGKGLVWFCPVVLIAFVSWREFHRKHRGLSFAILAAAAFRVLFIASRSDWHGGFCLGPRYLLMLVPFLILPAAPAIDQLIKVGDTKRLSVMVLCALACVVQQVYFAVGEPFAFLHMIKWACRQNGIDPFAGDLIFTSWAFTPLLLLLQGPRGPFLLRLIPVGNYALWMGSSLIACLLLFSAHVRHLRRLGTAANRIATKRVGH